MTFSILSFHSCFYLNLTRNFLCSYNIPNYKLWCFWTVLYPRLDLFSSNLKLFPIYFQLCLSRSLLVLIVLILVLQCFKIVSNCFSFVHWALILDKTHFMIRMFFSMSLNDFIFQNFNIYFLVKFCWYFIEVVKFFTIIKLKCTNAKPPIFIYLLDVDRLKSTMVL